MELIVFVPDAGEEMQLEGTGAGWRGPRQQIQPPSGTVPAGGPGRIIGASGAAAQQVPILFYIQFYHLHFNTFIDFE